MHAHGTRPRIQAGCLCNLCVLVRESWNPPQPRSKSVQARPVREHMEALYAAGWTPTGLAAHVGYAKSTLHSIASGRSLFTSRYIAEDILSVPIKEHAA